MTLEWRAPQDAPSCCLSYWRNAAEPLNGGKPDVAIDRGLASWGAIAAGKPIVPMAGELEHVTDVEIAAHGAKMQAKNITEGYFYTDTSTVSPSILAVIKAL
jgi:hypothetical protein